MTRRYAWAVLVVVVAAGCMDLRSDAGGNYEERTHVAVVPSATTPTNATQEQYYLIRVAGAENARLIKGSQDARVVCSTVQTFDVDPDRRTVRYDPSVHTLDLESLRVLLVLDYWGVRVDPNGVTTGCPTKQGFRGFAGRAEIDDKIRHDLGLQFVVEAQNGFLSYAGKYFVPMGSKIHVNLTRTESSSRATYYVTGDFEVENLGAWLKADIATVTNPGTAG